MSDDKGVRKEDVRDVEALVRARAHELWEAEGRPTNQAAEHWARARREVLGSDAGASPAADSFIGREPSGLGGPDARAEAHILAQVISAEPASEPVSAVAGGPSLSLDLPRSAMPTTPDPLGDVEADGASGAGPAEGDPGAVGLAEHPSPDAARSTSSAEGDPQPGLRGPDLAMSHAGAIPKDAFAAASPAGERGEPRPRSGRRPGAEQGRAGSPGTAVTVAAVALGALFLATRKRRR